jgi:phosphatidylserine/phosphatidylglycerophosphate/cardiolipin synthase-like enzyme/uncharacterized membrane protein YdjX (TVP38/TMEM64 family)
VTAASSDARGEARADGFLRPGANCWRRERATRAAVLVDADRYFRVLDDAFERARRSIWILGWDIHSRLELARGEPGEPSDPEHQHRLGHRLDRLASERPELEVRILCWDFAMLYVLERESFPVFRLDWSTHRRVHFELDAHHPLGASHHQKAVVIDGALAFVGGIDLTAYRWDTPEHRVDDPRRTTPSGASYGPFHDVQAAVSGPAAEAIEALARARWETATGEPVPATPADEGHDPWPDSLEVDLRDVEVGVARTRPAHDGADEVREVETAYVDAIAAARRAIYVENQYLSSSRIGDALAERLREADGPEIVLVGPRECSGWLEEATMGVLRARLLKRLKEADAHGRLRALEPVVSRERDVALTVHAKVMIVDDRLVRVGSSNLSNRSMGLDTECDLIFVASSDAHRGAARALRARLLAEHLGVDPERVTARLEETGSLVETVDDLAGGDRTLVPIDTEIEPWIDDLVPAEPVIDPEAPVDAEVLVSQLLADSGEAGDAPRRRPLRRVLLPIGVLLLLAALWRFSPLGDWITPERVVGLLRPVLDHRLGPVWVAGLFVAGSLVMVPVTAMIVATALLYGGVLGASVALAGSLAAAAVGYGLGHVLWRDLVRRLGGRALNRLSRMLARRGVMAVAAVRIVPIAPFTIVNLVAGASHLRFRDFLLGTALAMAPGIAVLTLVSRRVLAAVREPDPSTILGAVGALALAVAVFVLLRRRFERYGIARRDGETGSRTHDAA